MQCVRAHGSGLVLSVLGVEVSALCEMVPTELAHKLLLFKERPLARNLEQQIFQVDFDFW